MARLSEPVQLYITTALATYTSVSEVMRQVQQVFGVRTTMLQVIHYDAARPYCTAAKKWRDIFHQTRTEFLKTAARDGIARLEVRLSTLQRLAVKAEEQGNLKLAADLLRQAAEDAGGLYTNVRMWKGDPQAALASLLGVQPSEIPRGRAGDQGERTPLPPELERPAIRAARERAAGMKPMTDTRMGDIN